MSRLKKKIIKFFYEKMYESYYRPASLLYYFGFSVTKPGDLEKAKITKEL